MDKAGTLARITAIFGKNNVSIEQIIQKHGEGETAPLIFMTHMSDEKSIAKAVAALNNEEKVSSVDNVIRVI